MAVYVDSTINNLNSTNETTSTTTPLLPPRKKSHRNCAKPTGGLGDGWGVRTPGLPRPATPLRIGTRIGSIAWCHFLAMIFSDLVK